MKTKRGNVVAVNGLKGANGVMAKERRNDFGLHRDAKND